MLNQFLLYRIINGYYYSTFRNHRLKVVAPSAKIKYRANIFYEHLKDKLKYHEPDEWLSENKRSMILNFNQIWSNEKQKQLEDLEKKQDTLKVGLYLGFSVTKNREMFRKELEKNRRQVNELHFAKDTYIDTTKEFFLTKMKNLFILKNTVYFKNELFFKDRKNNAFLLEHFLQQYMTERIYQHIPKLIRSHDWANYWSASKGRITGGLVKNLNDEQLYAINASLAFDNIKKSYECPNQEILNDPDATEGWVLYQNKEREKDKKRQAAEDSLKGKSKDANEVFFMADSKEEEQEIYGLNDPANRKFIKEMQTYVNDELAKNKEKVEWVDIPAVQKQKMREKGLK